MAKILLKFNIYRNYFGRKFTNYVFKNRLGKYVWTTKIIIFIMNFLEKNQVYVNTSSVDNFDHYVPKLLLNRWKTESKENKKRILSWSKENKIIEPKSVDCVAGEVNWDTGFANGEPSDYISKKLYAEVLEQKSSFIIKYINTNKNPQLTFLEESTLSVFVAHQITRVPHFRNTLNKFFSLAYSKGLISKEDFGKRDVLANKVVKNSINITHDQLNKETPSIIISGTKQQQSLLSLIIATDLAERIYQKRYLKFIEIAEGDEDEFVISDNPVVFLDIEKNSILKYIPWWEMTTKKFIILMPISPKKALVYTPIKDDDNFPTQLFIEILNIGQYVNCTDGVFAKKESIIQKHLKHYKIT